jgi:hypothetical protein
LIVVDAANVVGSVPDGWWRNRVRATERLRDALAEAGPRALEGADDDARIVLVVEGVARRVRSVPGVRVVAAEGTGDDAIVDLVRRAVDEEDKIIVVTADRALRDRVRALGAHVVGPRALRIRRRRLPWRRRRQFAR